MKESQIVASLCLPQIAIEKARCELFGVCARICSNDIVSVWRDGGALSQNTVR